MSIYIHQKQHWPNFYWNNDELLNLLSEARNLQGRLLGKMQTLGFELQDEALLETLALDVLKSSEIEGEIYNPEQVRSSLAERLGLEYAGTVMSDRNVDGMVDMMIDATRNCFAPLTQERLFDWHAALFPMGRSGVFKITVAGWRKDEKGKMQVVSGAAGREKVHFQAPDAELLDDEMTYFLDWFNGNGNTDLVIKAAVAHLWFVTIHPFQDGNGRITRALTDMLLARSDKSTRRFYSMSAQIRIERNTYYQILEKTQKGDLDITEWISWFLNCLINALNASEKILKGVLQKSDFWNKHAAIPFNERQKKVLTKLLDDFEGKLTSQKWMKLTNCSKDTAVRDINDLIEKQVLQKATAGGRSTSYELVR
ncbi:MAG: Fic family protein [Bacteroidia bacterium]|jgi:Fic family protein|nr:Fic family protein [Bacteroidia bacterium]